MERCLACEAVVRRDFGGARLPNVIEVPDEADRVDQPNHVATPIRRRAVSVGMSSGKMRHRAAPDLLAISNRRPAARRRFGVTEQVNTPDASPSRLSLVRSGASPLQNVSDPGVATPSASQARRRSTTTKKIGRRQRPAPGSMNLKKRKLPVT